jgi:hypothetical protein
MRKIAPAAAAVAAVALGAGCGSTTTTVLHQASQSPRPAPAVTKTVPGPTVTKTVPGPTVTAPVPGGITCYEYDGHIDLTDTFGAGADAAQTTCTVSEAVPLSSGGFTLTARDGASTTYVPSGG